MTAERPLPAHTASEALVATIEARGWAVNDLTAAQAWTALLDFASVTFDVPGEDDADGLLYQYGTYNSSGEPAFHFNPTRQLALHDEDEYLQVHIEMRFEVTPDLVALGNHTEWWFDGDEGPLAAWALTISKRPEWSLLADLRPTSIEVHQDGT